MASSQVSQRFRMGVRVNAGLSNVKVFDWHKETFGYGIGWIGEYNFSSRLYLQSGIGLENIAKRDLSDTVNAYYMQIPAHVGYRYIINPIRAFFIQMGPTFGIGLFGSKIEQDSGRDKNYFDEARRFDIGVGGRIGVEVSKFMISAGVNYGLIKVFNYWNVCHNLSVNLGVAYMF